MTHLVRSSNESCGEHRWVRSRNRKAKTHTPLSNIVASNPVLFAHDSVPARPLAGCRALVLRRARGLFASPFVPFPDGDATGSQLAGGYLYLPLPPKSRRRKMCDDELFLLFLFVPFSEGDAVRPIRP